MTDVQWENEPVETLHFGDIKGQCLRPFREFQFQNLPWDSHGMSGITRIKRSHTRCVLKIDIQGPDGEPIEVFAKRCRARNWLKRLLSFGRASKSWQEWDLGRSVMHHGIATALPLAWAEKRHFGLMSENYLLTLGIENSLSFLQLWRALATEEQRALWLKRLGHFIRQAHEAGVAHDDLNADHVLITGQAGEEPKFWFIDLDHARVGAPVKPYRRVHNFFQIFRSLQGTDFGPTEQRLFFAGYSDGKWSDEHVRSVENALGLVKVQKDLMRKLNPRKWFK